MKTCLKYVEKIYTRGAFLFIMFHAFQRGRAVALRQQRKNVLSIYCPTRKKLCICIDLSACYRFGGERQNKSTRRRKQSMRRLENGSYSKQIDMKMKTTKLRQSVCGSVLLFLPVPQPMMATHFLTSYLPFSRHPRWTNLAYFRTDSNFIHISFMDVDSALQL